MLGCLPPDGCPVLPVSMACSSMCALALLGFQYSTLVGLAWENLYWKMIVLVLGEDYGIRRMKQCPGGGKCHEVLLAKAHSLQLPQGGVFL